MAAKSISYRYLVYSALNALKQVFSEKTITVEIVWFWTKIVVNNIKSKTINDEPTGFYAAIFTDVPIVMQYNSANNTLPRVRYFDAPANILNISRDDGIEWMAYYNTQKDPRCTCPIFFQRSTFIEVEMMKGHPLEKPSPEEPYFVRTKNRYYLYGIETLPQVKLNMAAYTAESPYLDQSGMDDEVNLTDEQVEDVMKELLVLGQWMLAGPMAERNETGADETQQQKQVALPQSQPQNVDNGG